MAKPNQEVKLGNGLLIEGLGVKNDIDEGNICWYCGTKIKRDWFTGLRIKCKCGKPFDKWEN